VIFYIILFYEVKLYSDAWLQLFYTIFQIYGWYYWLQNKGSHYKNVQKLKFKGWILVAVIISVSWSLWYEGLLFLKPDATLPFLDSFTTVTSLVAVYLQARKNIATWLLWIIADIIYLPMYIYKELYLTTALYALFLFLAVYGWTKWKRRLMIESN
jgi:nicotinamide mononucleotide transporter